jgi:hypothetical protein
MCGDQELVAYDIVMSRSLEVGEPSAWHNVRSRIKVFSHLFRNRWIRTVRQLKRQ